MAATHTHDPDIPRPVLVAAGLLLAAILLAVGAARMVGTAPSSIPPTAAVEMRRAMVLLPVDGGGVRAIDPDGAILTELQPGKDGFVRGVLRALHRIRDRSGVSLIAPVELVRWADGRHALIDPATGWRVELKGFGPDNLQTFATLLSEVAKGDPR